MAVKKYEVKIRVSILYAAGKELIKMLGELGTSKKLDIPVFYEKNESLGKWEFYINSEENKKKIGILENEEMSNTLQEIVDSEDAYEIFLSSTDGSAIMTGTLKRTRAAVEAKKMDTSVFDALKEKIVSEGICSAEQLDFNIKVMQDNRCPNELIMAVLKRYRKTERPAHRPKVVYVDPDKDSKETSNLALLLLNAIMGTATILEGDKSVGKNVCAETAAMCLNETYDMKSFTRSLRADDMYGNRETDNSASDKITQDLAEGFLLYQKGNEEYLSQAAEYETYRAKAASVMITQEVSPFVRWLREGGVFVFNEMNMAEANFFSSFTNQITDNSGFLDVPGVGHIDINKNCILIGTQNADYTGVCDQNSATMSRFGCISFDYPKSIKDQLMAAVAPDTRKILDEKYYIQTDKWYQTLLDSVKGNLIENDCLNIRGCVRALDAVAKVPGLVTLKKELLIHVINTCSKDDRPNILAALNGAVNL